MNPAHFVVSAADIEDDESTVGLFVHELLHNLGVGHTQKRPGNFRLVFKQCLKMIFSDRDNYVVINWGNIEKASHRQYERCSGPECVTYGTAYDCESIMHYRDWAFKTKDGGKTMTAINYGDCNLSDYPTKLSHSDVTLLKVTFIDYADSNVDMMSLENVL